MDSKQTSSLSTHNTPQNNRNSNQDDLYQIILAMNQKINNLEKDRKKNEDNFAQIIMSMENQMLQDKAKHKNDIIYLNNNIINLNNNIIYLNNILTGQKNQLNEQENQINEQENQINEQKNQINEQKNQINYLNYKLFQQNKLINQIQANSKNDHILFEIKYEQKFKELEKLILNLEKNYSISNKEITSFKIVKDMISSILSLLEVIMKEIESLYKKQKINEKDYQETNDKISSIISQVSEYSKKINDLYIPNFNIIFEQFENLQKQINKINNTFNYRIKNLEKDIEELKRKNMELQRIIISRKLIKIIIKYIIKYCVKNFTLENNSCKLNYLEMKYTELNSENVKEVINFLISKNSQINLQLHLVGGVDKIIKLLNSYGKYITFYDLLEIINLGDSKKKIIRKMMEIANISNINIYYDIIALDIELKEMLVELQNEIKDCK